MKQLKVKLAVATSVLLPSIMMAQNQDGKTILNDFIEKWLGPLFVFFIIGVAIRGIVINYSKITDRDGEGEALKGFKNIGVSLLYVLVAFAILAAILVAANAGIKTFKIG